MGWSIGFDSQWNRDIGYGVPATCDYPGCDEKIDRGLAHVCCNQEPYGGEHGCGLYFCGKHHDHYRRRVSGLCDRCATDQEPFVPTPDVPEWVEWKLTHESWAQWRDENPDEVARLRTTAPQDAGQGEK